MAFDFPNSPSSGDLVTNSSTGPTYRWDGSKWATAGPPATTVQSFNGRTGAITLTQGDVASGLGYTAYNAANPSGYIADAVNDGNAYVRRNAAWLNGDTRYMLQSAADARYVQLTGAVAMTGLLTLSGAPTVSLHAATKAYVDARPTGAFVATTTGSVSVTGTLTETNLAALRIPAGTVGANGVIEVKSLWTYPNNTNNKTLVTRFSTTSGATAGGLTGSNVVATTTQSAQTFTMIRNNNAANAQIFWSATPTTPFGTAATTTTALAVDTTVDTYVNLNGLLANVADTITLVHAYAVVFSHA